jgi:ubiquinone/menaquinone biosynthesis C-methylase UbiE
MVSKPSRNTYVIDPEKFGAETSRLLLQDKLFTQAMGGTLPPEYNLTGVTRLLDIACGPGGWALEVACEHPDIEVIGIDLSPTMIDYARSQAQVQRLKNATFLVMDVRAPFAFPDASFDLINARLLLTFMKPQEWAPLPGECLRLLRPGGWLHWTEVETAFTTSAAYERYSRLFAQALYRAGQSFSPDGYHLGLLPMMLPLLRQAGFQNVYHQTAGLEGSFGIPAYASAFQDTELTFKLIQPFLLGQGVASQEELERVYQQVVADWQDEHFCALFFLFSAWGQKA